MVWPFHSNKRPSLRRLLIGLAVSAAIGGAATWFVYFHVLKAGFAEVVPGQVYRSGQPSPSDIRDWVGRYHIRTVVSLRGEKVAAVVEEKKVARELGVQVVAFSFSADRLPSTDRLRQLIGVLESAPRPILIHCRSGVDRTGMASAVAVLVVGKSGLDSARKQLPWVETRSGPDYVSDVIGQYSLYCRNSGTDPDDSNTFTKWAREVYQAKPDPKARMIPRMHSLLPSPETAPVRSSWGVQSAPANRRGDLLHAE